METARLPRSIGKYRRREGKEQGSPTVGGAYDLTNKLDDMSERELLKYALNMVHKQSVVAYLTHHYSHEVVTTFTVDSPFLVDQSLVTRFRLKRHTYGLN
jgi:hypothetical protein